MPIANREEVTVLETHDVRICNVSVLVHLIRVVRRDASFRREGELSDNIDYLLLLATLTSFLLVFLCLLDSACIIHCCWCH